MDDLPLTEGQEAELHRHLGYYRSEAARCTRARAYLAGCVMAAAAREAILLLMVNAYRGGRRHRPGSPTQATGKATGRLDCWRNSPGRKGCGLATGWPRTHGGLGSSESRGQRLRGSRQGDRKSAPSGQVHGGPLPATGHEEAPSLGARHARRGHRLPRGPSGEVATRPQGGGGQPAGRGR